MKAKIPMYTQIENYIKEKILSEELKPYDLIPSEPVLAKMFEVSRMTARSAVDNLVNNGFVYRVKGKGTFVNHKKFDRGERGLKSFSEEMIERGLKPSHELLNFSIIEASYAHAKWLNCDKCDKIYQIERLMLANDMPMAYEIIYREVKVTPGLTKNDFQGKSVYKQLEDLNIKIDHADQQVEAILPHQSIADLLGLEINNGVLLIKSVTYTKNQEIVQFTKSYYRADQYALNYQIYRNNN